MEEHKNEFMEALKEIGKSKIKVGYSPEDDGGSSFSADVSHPELDASVSIRKKPKAKKDE